jgi:hypothetical protein
MLLNGYGNDYGANTRADLGAMSRWARTSAAIEQAYALAPLAASGRRLAVRGTPFQLFNGQTINTNGTTNGTTTTTTSPNLFQMLMQGAQNAAQSLCGREGLNEPVRT